MYQKRYKNKVWDGYENFLKEYDKKYDLDTAKKIAKYRFGVGLWKEAVKAMESEGIEYTIDNIDEMIDRGIDQVKLNTFVELLLDGVTTDTGDQIAPRDYQFESAYRALKYKYCTQELATSAGKTIIFYIYICYLKAKRHINKNGKKALIVVPKVGLLNQTYDAFVKEYNNGLIELNIMRLGDKYKFKKELFDDCELLITTYQSLSNIEDPQLYKQFNVVCIDEAHSASGASISTILKLSTNARYRFGLSGTISVKTEYSQQFKVQEYLGPLCLIVTSSFLQENGYSPNIEIKMLKLIHPMNKEIGKMDLLRQSYKTTGLPEGYVDAKEFGKAMFEMEKQYLYTSERRLQVIGNLVRKLPGNTLILFNNIKDGYGVRIQEAVQQVKEKVYYIDGSVETDDRADFQQSMEANEGVVIVASYGTFSTGLNLKRLHNIIFAESSKSEITIRQSIGRGMRKYFEKNLVYVFDLCDEFEGVTVPNYMMEHAKVRESIYSNHKFVYSERDVRL